MAKKQTDSVSFTMNVPAPIVFPLLSWDAVNKARARGLKVDSFGGDLLFSNDHEDVPGIKKAMAQAAKLMWPDRPFSELRFPWKLGDTMADLAVKKQKNKDYLRGFNVLRVKSPVENREKEKRDAPTVYDIRNPSEPVISAEAIDKLIYSGALVAAQLSFKGTEGNGSTITDGVTCYLNSIMFIKDGKRIGVRDGAAVFSGIVGRAKDEDPTGGVDLDDEIPF